MSDDFRNTSSHLFVKLRKYHYQGEARGGEDYASIRQKWRGKNCTFQCCKKSYSLRMLHHLSPFHVYLLPCFLCYGFCFWRLVRVASWSKLWHNDYVTINTRNMPSWPTPVATRSSRGPSESNRSCEVTARNSCKHVDSPSPLHWRAVTARHPTLLFEENVIAQ